MKKGITIISILVAIVAAVVFWFGGFQSGKGEPAETKWKGDPLESAAIPVAIAEWTVLVIWERQPSHAREGADIAGPFPYVIRSKTAPTLESIQAANLVFPLAGNWKPAALFDVKLSKPGTPMPDPIKEQPEKPVKEQL